VGPTEFDLEKPVRVTCAVHSLHNLPIAVSDPPLVGWAEVSHTLTGTGSGNRKRGGGRFEQLPDTSHDVKWVRRNLI